MTDLLLSVSLAAHLLLVNVAMSGPLFAVWLERRGRKLDQELPGELGHRIAKASWHSLVGAMVLGIVSALIIHIPGEEWFAELGQMPHARVFWGSIELLFSLTLMIIYAQAWKKLAGRPWVHRGLAILAATNLIYHFPTFFVIFSKLRDEGRLTEQVTKSEFRGLILDPEVLARSLHYLLASIAVTGVVVMLMATKRYLSDEDETAPPQRIAIGAGRAALVATILQLPVGFWVFVSVPLRDRDRIMGDDLWAGGLMLVGILSAVLLLHTLASVSFGESERAKVRAAALWILVTVVAMTGMLVRLRVPGPLTEENMGGANIERRPEKSPVGNLDEPRADDAVAAKHEERETEWRQFKSQTPRVAQPRRLLRS